ncbi:MAG: glutathione S-transferase family protein [Oscillatoria sp. PMC 1068.18]|nr:glutathione S-transferase family protein [Oscillatoria sp. PMC 1076.18]MEC4991282.1 glutathione S-transferase family protein [Oscillatoria sp. PMC 1068.18]
MATGMMIDGEWRTEGYEKDDKGRFKRNSTTFRNSVTADGSSGFKAESGRYHLYVSYACPWAHRTLIMRELKGLSEAISISVVDPYMGENGWQFSDAPGTISDPIFQAKYLREVYKKADENYTGRVTVPILWDTEKGTIVNNESREIIRMFDREFEAIAKNKVNLCLPDLESEIDKTIDAIYQPINNGVYRAGFAQSQVAYEEAVTELFAALDDWEKVLAKQPYLCGKQLTEADICMFTTLIRFDLVYYVHFKCNLRHIYEYPNLWNYLKNLYQHPGVKETCNFAHIKQHYYQSHPHINPSGIVPTGPIINFEDAIA